MNQFSLAMSNGDLLTPPVQTSRCNKVTLLCPYQTHCYLVFPKINPF